MGRGRGDGPRRGGAGRGGGEWGRGAGNGPGPGGDRAGRSQGRPGASGRAEEERRPGGAGRGWGRPGPVGGGRGRPGRQRRSRDPAGCGASGARLDRVVDGGEYAGANGARNGTQARGRMTRRSPGSWRFLPAPALCPCARGPPAPPPPRELPPASARGRTWGPGLQTPQGPRVLSASGWRAVGTKTFLAGGQRMRRRTPSSSCPASWAQWPRRGGPPASLPPQARAQGSSVPPSPAAGLLRQLRVDEPYSPRSPSAPSTPVGPCPHFTEGPERSGGAVRRTRSSPGCTPAPRNWPQAPHSSLGRSCPSPEPTPAPPGVMSALPGTSSGQNSRTLPDCKPRLLLAGWQLCSWGPALTVPQVACTQPELVTSSFPK